MAKLLTPKTSLFEAVTCSRCCGTGEYSFNLVNGTRCFGCGGQGVKLTKRGAAATAYYKQLLSKPASELIVGDVVKFDMYFFICWAPITEIVVNDGGIHLRAVRKLTGETISIGVPPDTLVQRRLCDADRLPLVANALAFQASLTKTGKPAKRKIAVAA